jgi:hypothetical protein
MAMWQVGFRTGSPAGAAPRKVLNKVKYPPWRNGFGCVLGKAQIQTVCLRVEFSVGLADLGSG